MTLPGECVRDVETSCVECGAHLEIQVCKSMAGYHVGFWCGRYGPYSRESGYYRSHEDAEEALNRGTYARV
jgi:hypothetical protein